MFLRPGETGTSYTALCTQSGLEMQVLLPPYTLSNLERSVQYLPTHCPAGRGLYSSLPRHCAACRCLYCSLHIFWSDESSCTAPSIPTVQLGEAGTDLYTIACLERPELIPPYTLFDLEKHLRIPSYTLSGRERPELLLYYTLSCWGGLY